MNQKNLMEITSLDHGHLSGGVGDIDGDVMPPSMQQQIGVRLGLSLVLTDTTQY